MLSVLPYASRILPSPRPSGDPDLIRMTNRPQFSSVYRACVRLLEGSQRALTPNLSSALRFTL